MLVRIMSNVSSNLPNDPPFLKAIITALQAENAKMSATLKAHDHLIHGLRLRIARLKKQIFGKSSEKIEGEIAQLALEDLLVAAAENQAAPHEELEDDMPSIADETSQPRPLRRRPRVSENAVRERRELDPGHCRPACGGELRLVGEDVSEILDMIAATMKVIEIARPKKSCLTAPMELGTSRSRTCKGSLMATIGPGLQDGWDFGQSLSKACKRAR